MNVHCGDAAAPPPTARVDPAERAAYTAFYNEEDVDAKIHLAEQFDEKYPNSIYEDSVDSALTSLYYNKQDWAKFYAIGEKVIAKNPKNLAILELVGWAIPRNSGTDPVAASKLDEAITYEKRALALIAAMKKPKEVDQQDFGSSIEGLSWRAYSGLGLAYFREKEYADSAAALEIAVKDEAPKPAGGDLWALGVDLENLHRKSEAIEAFSKCFGISGDLQDRCEQDLRKAKAELSESAEDGAYEAFISATNTDAQIYLGEMFDQAYPGSEYEESVDTALTGLYGAKQEWSKFYATADKVLAKDANNVPVLASVAWAIPHNYDANDPNASAKLNEAEKYGKHALDLVGAMQKPADLTEEQFDQAKEQATAQAHSGLGIAYFRQGAFANSANELQLATADTSQVSAFDLYILGIDLQKVNRSKDAAQAFGKCSAMQGSLEAQCQRDAEMASKAVAQLTAVAAKPAANSAQPSTGDIPPLRTPESGPAIKSETMLVPVRVVVRDPKGNAVAGLKRDDFKLYQDGKQVEISGFNAIAQAMGGVGANAAAVTPIAAGSATEITVGEKAPPGQPDRFIGLFFDDFHLTFEDLVQTREAAEKYLSTLQPRDRAAIMTSSGEGETDFTADRDKLSKAMLNIKPHPASGLATAAKDCPPMSYTEADAIINKEDQRILQGATMAALICAFANDPYLTPAARSLALNTARAELFLGNLQTSAVFRRLQGEVQRLSAMAGERNLVLVSRGFNYETHEAEFSELIDRAIHANVTVNALDAKGMYVSDDDRDASSSVTADEVRKGSFQDVEKLNRMGQAENDYVLSDLVDATGGIFFHADNGFAAGFKELVAPPESYYLLSYAPQNLAADGKYHVLKVSLARRSPDRVQARRGFYAPSHLETPEEAAKREIEDALFSQDQQNDLPVKLETALAPGTSGAEKLSVKANVDPTQLTFQKVAGLDEENLTVAAVLFDSNGNYVDGTQKVDQMKLDDATLAQLKKTGFYLEMAFDVKPGEYVVRLVARDSNDQHLTAQNATVDVP